MTDPAKGQDRNMPLSMEKKYGAGGPAAVRQGTLWGDVVRRFSRNRAAMGGMVSLLIAFSATGVVLSIGVLYGSLAGFLGGRTDNVMMRIIDVLYGLPYLPFAIILLVILGSGIAPMLLALAFVSWLTPARLVRGQILTLKENEYVEAARALGASRRRLVTRHLLPNTFGIIVIAMFLEVPGMILGEAFLSFLGLGISAPDAS